MALIDNLDDLGVVNAVVLGKLVEVTMTANGLLTSKARMSLSWSGRVNIVAVNRISNADSIFML